jgi:hypothetical protein
VIVAVLPLVVVAVEDESGRVGVVTPPVLGCAAAVARGNGDPTAPLEAPPARIARGRRDGAAARGAAAGLVAVVPLSAGVAARSRHPTAMSGAVSRVAAIRFTCRRMLRQSIF